MRPFIIEAGRRWSEKLFWLGEMVNEVHQMIVLLFRGAWPGWRNGLAGVSWNPVKGNSQSCT